MATAIASNPWERARSAIASTPDTRRIDPSRASSPASTQRSSDVEDNWPEAASTAAAIARSNAGPALGRFAGARLAVIRCCGNFDHQRTTGAIAASIVTRR